MSQPSMNSRSRRAASAEARIESLVALFLRRMGWRPQVVGFPGYGLAGPGGWTRLLARVLMLPPRPQVGDEEGGRGWRRFLTVAVPDADIRVRLGGRSYVVRSGLAGFVDAVVPSHLPPGRHEVELVVADSVPAVTEVHLVGPDQQRGVVSDIDDTVMVTALPRPLLAAWNTFVRTESSRRPVPGMAAFLHAVRGPDDDSPVVYVSTGAWNVAPMLGRFLDRHGYPAGPLLLTDWGPTDAAWFRSGRGHKKAALRRLVAELPQVRWTLVGDDGQHDPTIYEELQTERPDAVRIVAIRELSPTEQVLTHGLPLPPTDQPVGGSAGPWLRAPDGHGLLRLLARTEGGPLRAAAR